MDISSSRADHETLPAVMTSFDQHLAPITILGVHMSNDAYPNVRYRIAALSREPTLSVQELNFPLSRIQWFGQGGGGIAKVALWVRSVTRFAYAHIRVMIAALSVDRSRTVYVPYPAVFVVFLLSLLPNRRRPTKIIVDAFISLYDTLVFDRKVFPKHHFLARLLYRIERRAFLKSDTVIVDTEENAQAISAQLAIPLEKFRALPLAINEDIYAPRPYLPRPKRCRVLFTGTFVPLQGVDIIARAIVLLRTQTHIDFHLIGNGQTAAEVASILEENPCSNVLWEREWKPAEYLAECIAESDVCLGVFGSGEKAERVWPFKNYAYMCVGRAIITGDTPTARRMLLTASDSLFATVHMENPDQLAKAILELASSPERRTRLATASRRYYEQHLSQATSIPELARLVSK